MSLGEFRNKIVLQTLGGSTDSGGGQTSTYSTATTVWAKAENISGSENIFGDQLRGVSSYRFMIRYYSALTVKHRISYNSKTFNIVSFRSISEGKERYQEITASEGVAT